MDNMKIMEPNKHSYYDDNLNSKIIMKQVNSPGLTLNYSGESTLTRKPKMHFLVNGGSLPRSMTLQSKEKVHLSNDSKTNVGQQMDETCQQLARLTSQSGSLNQPTSSATVTSSTATNKSASKLTKTITSPCLRKLRSTLFPGSRDSRRAPILVNNTTELESPNDQYNEDNQNNDDDIINPPLSARSISTPALNLQLATQPPEADYRPYPASNFSHSSTILHQQQHQMMPIMNSSMCNHYSGNMHYNNQSQQQFNDSYYLRDNYATYNNNNNVNSKYYTSNDNIGPDRSYLTATPVSCNYGYLPNQVYSNQQSRTLPQLYQQQHQQQQPQQHQQQQQQHLIPKTNSTNQHQCLPARVGANCSQSTNNNVDKIYNSPQTIGPQQQYHQQPVKVQSQHRFVEVCRPEELRQNDNYVSSSSLNKNNDRKSASEQDLGSHIVVVSSYENNQTHGLTVKNSSASHNKISEDDSNLRHYHQPEASSPIDDECKTDNALNHMIVTSASSPDLAYKSSSDSGRGTRTSESGSAEVRDSASVSPPLDITSLDSDQTDSHRSDKPQQCNPNPSTAQSSVITLDKMQADLKKILEDDDELTSDGGGININTGLSLSLLKNQCSRLPVVHESDSWISDSSKTVDEPEKSSSKKIESNSGKKKDPPTLSQQQSIKGSLTTNRNLLMNGRGEISGNINKNGLLSKKLQPMEKSLPSKLNVNNTMTTDISSTNNPITGQNKTPNKPKLGQTHLSNVKYGGIGKGLKLTTNKRWRHPLAEETGSVTTLGLESVDDVDDLTSEYTANTDAWENHENTHVRKQLSGLENMYSEILNLLGSRMHGAKKSMHHSSSGKLNRRLSGSVSSLSVASRDAFYSRNNKYLHRRDDFDSKGARRLKRLEGHVITLARSVSQLSSEIRSSQCLIEDVQTLRKDVDRIQEQLRCFKLTPLMDGGTLRRSTANNQSDPKDSTDKLRSEVTGKNNKLDKIKRFFGDEPPLRQFLKKLGYEKYASKFESEKIGLKELSALNEEKLIKLGIPMGPRVRILQELNKIHSPHSNIYLV